MTDKILILDFGSQYTQLIARAVREASVYCEIIPYNKPILFDETLKGIILSGSPFSVNEVNAPSVDVKNMVEKLPVLGVCYGAQLTAKLFGGRVDKSEKREYGRASLKIENHEGFWCICLFDCPAFRLFRFGKIRPIKVNCHHARHIG